MLFRNQVRQQPQQPQSLVSIFEKLVAAQHNSSFQQPRLVEHGEV